jgi:hypothetical protein
LIYQTTGDFLMPHVFLDPEEERVNPSPDTAAFTLCCRISGIPLFAAKPLVSFSLAPHIFSQIAPDLVHPYYKLSLSQLLDKAVRYIHSEDQTQRPPRILFSALAHALGHIKQGSPGLPSATVVAASFNRLVELAAWKHNLAKTCKFPDLHLTRVNANEQWQNIAVWIDNCFEIRREWETRVRKYKNEQEIEAAQHALKAIRDEVYVNLDIKKLWNWIALQLDASGTATGRIETFRQLFLYGDINVELWTIDDIEDLQEAVLMHCDVGNSIMFAVNKIITNLRIVIRDFYSSFVVLDDFDASDSDSNIPDIIRDADRQIAALGTLPPSPQRSAFSTATAHAVAQAKWNILARRWEALQSSKSKVAGE